MPMYSRVRVAASLVLCITAGRIADDLALMKKSRRKLASPVDTVRAGEALDSMTDSVRELGQL